MIEEEAVCARETTDMFVVKPPVELLVFKLGRLGEILRVPLTEVYASRQRRRLISKDACLLTKKR